MIGKLIEGKTQQELYDFVALHLLKQGWPSMLGEDCAYRDGKGGKCAAGCLITDDEYTPNGIGIEGLSWAAAVDRAGITYHEVDFIYALQIAHDNAERYNSRVWLAGWRGRMLALAENYQLSTEVFDNYDKEQQCATQ